MTSKRLPSVAEYRTAFETVRLKITPIQWKMLETHFLAPNHTATAGEIATAAGNTGISGYRITNSSYARLGRRLRRALKRPAPRGHALVGIFSYFLAPDHHNPYWRFVMRRPAVQALKTLRWFDEDASVSAGSTRGNRTRSIAEDGRIRMRLSIHRSRERSLRAAKLASAIAASSDRRLHCEVPGCGFDFAAVYGELGAGFAEVHHLRALAEMDGPVETTLADLSVVCANCHRMIHVGAACRDMKTLISPRRPALRRPRRTIKSNSAVARPVAD